MLNLAAQGSVCNRRRETEMGGYLERPPCSWMPRECERGADAGTAGCYDVCVRVQLGIAERILEVSWRTLTLEPALVPELASPTSVRLSPSTFACAVSARDTPCPFCLFVRQRAASPSLVTPGEPAPTASVKRTKHRRRTLSVTTVPCTLFGHYGACLRPERTPTHTIHSPLYPRDLRIAVSSCWPLPDLDLTCDTRTGSHRRLSWSKTTTSPPSERTSVPPTCSTLRTPTPTWPPPPRPRPREPPCSPPQPPTPASPAGSRAQESLGL
jgi:hypothetical protein